MSEPAVPSRRATLVKLAVVAAVLVVGAVLVLRGFDVKGTIERVLATVRSAGPVAFFAAQAVLPALGAPQTAFSIPAGSLFGAQLGMPVVVLLSTLALAANMALSYWLASSLMRPLCEKVVARLGFKIPSVESGDVTDLIVLLRVTPGMPFPVQNYVLGLARVPFLRYLVVSLICQGPLNAAIVVFGDALLHGKGRMALLGLLAILALAVATHLVRKHYGKKRA